MNPEEVLAAFNRAHAAGDTEAAGKLAKLYESMTPEKPQMDTESGNIASPLGQGLSFGFSDEIAGGAGALINSGMNLFGKGTGESFGDAYRGIRDAARYNQDAFATRNPKTALAAEIGGGLLTGGAGAARVGALKGTQSLARLGGLGAAQGAAYGVGASEADSALGVAGDAAVGGLLGGVGGVLLPAAGRAVADRLKRAGSAVSAAGQPPPVTGLLDDAGNFADDAAAITGARTDDVYAGATVSQNAQYADDVATLLDKGRSEEHTSELQSH